MRIFRKRKKFGNFRGPVEDADPLPDIVYQMAAESAANFAAMGSNAQQGVYGYPPMEENYDEVRSSSPLKFMASVLGIGRSRSREPRAARPNEQFIEAGSPVRFREGPPGTPVKYRRRPASPELVRSRPSSTIHFAQQERASSPAHFARPPSHPNSPDVIRRLHRAQLSQDLQRVEREQRLQQEMMLMNSTPFMPQYQQVPDPYYSLINGNPYLQTYPSMQPQPQMYSFY